MVLTKRYEQYSDVPAMKELRLIATREQVSIVVAKYMQRRRALLTSFLEQLRELRAH